MQRTESKSIQVHPNDEQYYINIMQVFHWNLKSSQELKLKDTKIENRGGTLYNVTQTEHYIKLVYERPYEFPNRARLVSLEEEFFNMVYPTKSGYTTAIIVTIIAAIVIAAATDIAALAILPLAGGAYWLYYIMQQNQKVEQRWAQNEQRKLKIVEEANSISSFEIAYQ